MNGLSLAPSPVPVPGANPGGGGRNASLRKNGSAHGSRAITRNTRVVGLIARDPRVNSQLLRERANNLDGFRVSRHDGTPIGRQDADFIHVGTRRAFRGQDVTWHRTRSLGRSSRRNFRVGHPSGGALSLPDHFSTPFRLPVDTGTQQASWTPHPGQTVNACISVIGERGESRRIQVECTTFIFLRVIRRGFEVNPTPSILKRSDFSLDFTSHTSSGRKSLD
jgi:hypothetical protein